MSTAELFLLAWAIVATIFAVYYNTNKMYFKERASVFAQTLLLVATKKATIDYKDGAIVLEGFSGMTTENGNVIKVHK
jgi:hypothetical protein